MLGPAPAHMGRAVDASHAQQIAEKNDRRSLSLPLSPTSATMPDAGHNKMLIRTMPATSDSDRPRTLASPIHPDVPLAPVVPLAYGTMPDDGERFDADELGENVRRDRLVCMALIGSFGIRVTLVFMLVYFTLVRV